MNEQIKKKLGIHELALVTEPNIQCLAKSIGHQCMVSANGAREKLKEAKEDVAISW